MGSDASVLAAGTLKRECEEMAKEREGAWALRVAAIVDRWVRWGVKHWLLWVNVAFFLYVLFPLLAPVFMHLGWREAGRFIYLVYTPFCHQLPERSFFLFGPKGIAAYTLGTLQAHGLDPASSPWQRRFFVGSPDLGYKMAFCERDLALYGGFLLMGLIYALTRRFWRPLSWRLYLLSLLPMALDGGTQLVGLRESTWGLRVTTGLLLAFTTIWALYPRMDNVMMDAVEDGKDHQSTTFVS